MLKKAEKRVLVFLGLVGLILFIIVTGFIANNQTYWITSISIGAAILAILLSYCVGRHFGLKKAKVELEAAHERTFQANLESVRNFYEVLQTREKLNQAYYVLDQLNAEFYQLYQAAIQAVIEAKYESMRIATLAFVSCDYEPYDSPCHCNLDQAYCILLKQALEVVSQAILEAKYKGMRIVTFPFVGCNYGAYDPPCHRNKIVRVCALQPDQDYNFDELDDDNSKEDDDPEDSDEEPP